VRACRVRLVASGSCWTLRRSRGICCPRGASSRSWPSIGTGCPGAGVRRLVCVGAEPALDPAGGGRFGDRAANVACPVGPGGCGGGRVPSAVEGRVQVRGRRGRVPSVDVDVLAAAAARGCPQAGDGSAAPGNGTAFSHVRPLAPPPSGLGAARSYNASAQRPRVDSGARPMMAPWRTSNLFKASWTRWPAQTASLFDAMADDVSWRWMGVSSWSKTFEGKQQVVDELFGGVEETLTDSFSVQVHEILADGQHVVVEHTGHNTTPRQRIDSPSACPLCRAFGAEHQRNCMSLEPDERACVNDGPES